MSYSTIEFKKKYKDLNETLYWLIQQSIESIPYCQKKWGENNSIKNIWTIGKMNLRYKNDKKGVEQIQSAGTLFENNIHGISGAGDCDCFTVFTIAMLLANGYQEKNILIVLQGRKKNQAVHIFTAVKDPETNKLIYIDFTEPHFNTKRKYPFIQFVPIQKFL